MDFKTGVGIGAGIAVAGVWIALGLIASARIKARATSHEQGRDWRLSDVGYVCIGLLAAWGTVMLVGMVT
ncbi:hypothetical protein [Phenylobacterium sp.]|uniref:hypothetical protein n=1 Tax=Phenylobacterium sp. TaxID=1871053 RepID=UPI0025EB1AFC|nr:hypothetical protein [Phenylobacterium sp.]